MNIQYWWSQLNQREKIALLFMGLFIYATMLYAVWLFLNTEVSQKQQDIADKIEILQYILDNEHSIKQTPINSNQQNSMSTFSAVEQSFKQNQFSNAKVEIQTNTNKQVQVTLNPALYSDIIAVVEKLKNLGIHVSQFEAKRTDTAGFVQARIIFSSTKKK